MKKLSKINRITLVIIGTFSIMILMSLITSNEAIMILMGDTKCDILELQHKGFEYYSNHWHYSWTHWMYNSMGIALFVVQIAKIVNIAAEE